MKNRFSGWRRAVTSKQKMMRSVPILAYCVALLSLVLTSASRALAVEGGVGLLSTGCTSNDAYPDFEARGEDFQRWVGWL